MEHVTCLHNSSRIDGDVSFIDVLDDAFLIDQERGPVSKTLLFVKDTISLDYGAFEIAEEWKRDFELFCEFTVGGNTVYTQAKNLGVGCFELCDISLIRFELLRSTTGERQHVDRQHDILLAFEIAELVSLSVSGPQREVRSGVTDLQVCFGWRWLLRKCRNAEHGNRHEGYQKSF